MQALQLISTAGPCVLSWLSNLSLADHGYLLPLPSQLVKLDSYLGSGSFSDVYREKMDDQI